MSALLGAGIGAALVDIVAGWLRDRGQRKRNAAYVGLRIAVALENFSDECFSRFSDIDLYNTSGGRAGKDWQKMPPTPAYPTDDDGWRALDISLAEKALTLPGRLAQSQGLVDFTFEHVSPSDATDTCLDECAAMGIEALEIAAALRTAYRFPSFKSYGEKHFREHLVDRANDDTQKLAPPTPPGGKLDSPTTR